MQDDKAVDDDPGKYLAMVRDPERCLAEAAEILDIAREEVGNGREVTDLSALANRWMRLAELSMKFQEKS